MARKFGSVEIAADGKSLSFKSSLEVDPVTVDVEIETCLDGTKVLQEMHKTAKISGTIQVPEKTGVVRDLASIREATVRVIVGHLTYTYPRAALKTTGGVNEKGELGIEIYPLSAPIEEVAS